MERLGRVLAALALAILPSAAAERTTSVFAGADPDMEVVQGEYWIYPTDSGRGDALFAWRSPDMRHWAKGPALIELEDVRWIGEDHARRHYLWAPDMVQANGRYHFYYSVGPQDPTPSRLGVATCAGPAGPCVDSGRPLFTGGKGFEAIDPAVFVDPKTGTPYLYAGGSAGAKLRTWVLTPDMTALDHEVPVETPPNFTEGAFMHYRNGLYYLSYSVGRWNMSSYQIHYAVSLSPMGPWRYGGAILQSDRLFKGPGHHAFLKDPKDGSWWIVYHRWEGKKGDGPYTDQRRIVIQPLHYREDGAILPVRMD